MASQPLSLSQVPKPAAVAASSLVPLTISTHVIITWSSDCSFPSCTGRVPIDTDILQKDNSSFHSTQGKFYFSKYTLCFLLRFARIIFVRQWQRTLRVELALQPLSPEAALPAALNVTAAGSTTQTRVAALTLSLILCNL